VVGKVVSGIGFFGGLKIFWGEDGEIHQVWEKNGVLLMILLLVRYFRRVIRNLFISPFDFPLSPLWISVYLIVTHRTVPLALHSLTIATLSIPYFMLVASIRFDSIPFP